MRPLPGPSRPSARRVAHPRAALILLLSALVALLLACGGGDRDDGGGSPTTAPTASDDPLVGAVAELTLELQLRDIAFSADELEATTDVVIEIRLENKGTLDHDFTIEKLPADVSAVGKAAPEKYDVHVPLERDEEARLLIRVREAGEYTFFCAVPGHRQAGMEGRLVIR